MQRLRWWVGLVAGLMLAASIGLAGATAQSGQANVSITVLDGTPTSTPAATVEPTATAEPVSHLPTTGGQTPAGSAASGTMLTLGLLGACTLVAAASIRTRNRPAT